MKETVRLTFRHHLDDMLEYNRHVREQRLKGWLVGLLAVGMVATGLSMVAYPREGREPWIIFVAAAVFGAIALGTTRLAAVGAWLLKTDGLPIELEVGEEGVAYLHGDERIVVGWGEFRRWFETPRVLALVAKREGEGLAIPRRCCDDAEWERLRRVVSDALGEPSGW